MTFGKVLRVLAVLSVAGAGAAMARDHSSGTPGAKGTIAASVKGDKAIKGEKFIKGDKVMKGDKANARSGQGAVAVRLVKPPAPIVMGRSVSEHRKTKLHHVKIKPLDSIDSPDSGGGSH